MEVISNYFIMKPFQLPWMYVSPADSKGLEYHLSPDLSIRLDGIISGDLELVIGHIVLAVEGIEANELDAESIFLNEFFPAKSKERIFKSFKDGQSSCFFNSRQMEYLQKLFTEKNFMSYNVTVFYKDKKVEMIEALPPKEFKMVMEVFNELQVQGAVDFKLSREEIEERYEKSYEKKVASLEEKTKKSLWEKVRNKDIRWQLLKSIGSIAIGIGGLIARNILAQRGDVLSSIVAVILGTLGILVELYGRQEAQNTLYSLRIGDRPERMVF